MGRHLKRQLIPDRAPVGQRNGSVKSVSQRVYWDSRQEHGKGMYGLLFLIALIQSLTEAAKGEDSLWWLTAWEGCSPIMTGRHGGRNMRWQPHCVCWQVAEANAGAQLAFWFSGSQAWYGVNVQGGSLWKLSHRNTQIGLLGHFLSDTLDSWD